MGDEFRVLRELGRIAGHAVVEARTGGHQEIAVLDRIVGKGRTVHSEHAHAKRIGRVDCADAHQGGHRGNLELPREFPQGLRSSRIDHPAPGVDQRTLGLGQCGEKCGTGSFRQLRRLEAVHALAVTRYGQASRAVKHPFPVLHVLGDIEHHRPRAPGAGNLEGRADRGFQLGGVRDQEHVLGHRAHDAGHGRLLERVRADRGGGDLAANDHDGHGVGLGVPHRRDGIGGLPGRTSPAQRRPVRSPGHNQPP